MLSAHRSQPIGIIKWKLEQTEQKKNNDEVSFNYDRHTKSHNLHGYHLHWNIYQRYRSAYVVVNDIIAVVVCDRNQLKKKTKHWTCVMLYSVCVCVCVRDEWPTFKKNDENDDDGDDKHDRKKSECVPILIDLICISALSALCHPFRLPQFFP